MHAAELSEQQELLQRLVARVSSLTRAEADGKSAAERLPAVEAELESLRRELGDARSQLDARAHEHAAQSYAMDAAVAAAVAAAAPHGDRGPFGLPPSLPPSGPPSIAGGGASTSSLLGPPTAAAPPPRAAQLELAVRAGLVEAAELRQQLVAGRAEWARDEARLREELQATAADLEAAERRWRCHKHDGETKVRLLEEQMRVMSSKSAGHAELRSLGSRLAAAQLAEASARQLVAEAQAQAEGATERESRARRRRRRARGAARCGRAGHRHRRRRRRGRGRRPAVRCDCQQLERLLLQQRDEVTDLRRRLSAAVVAETLTTNEHEIASKRSSRATASEPSSSGAATASGWRPCTSSATTTAWPRKCAR